MIKQLLPPILLKKATGLFYGWSGNYASWAEAKAKCTGYNSDVIFNKVKAASLKVKNGEAVFERDSVVFDKVQYSFPLLAALNIVALNKKGKLNVLDFGGSLGSSYYQNRLFFKNLEEFNWCVVEQVHFVEEGQKTFADRHLHFFYDINSCTGKFNIDILLLASVLQYLENPYKFLEEIIDKKIEYLIIDRTPITSSANDRITVQKVPKKIYNASYPCWILSEKKLMSVLLKHYDLLFDNDSNENINIDNAGLKAYFLKLKK